MMLCGALMVWRYAVARYVASRSGGALLWRDTLRGLVAHVAYRIVSCRVVSRRIAPRGLVQYVRCVCGV